MYDPYEFYRPPTVPWDSPLTVNEVLAEKMEAEAKGLSMVLDSINDSDAKVDLERKIQDLLKHATDLRHASTRDDVPEL